MSLSGFGRFICKLISESTRLILFFASIAFLLLSTLLLLMTSQNRYAYDIIQVEQCDYYFLAIKLMSIYLIVLSIFGIHGSFFRNDTTINLFAFLASLNIILGFALFYFATPGIHESTLKVSHILEDMQPNYDWFHNHENKNTSVTLLDATSKWDAVQENHQCCGLHSPNDWLSFRPKDYSGFYPISCCQSSTETLSPTATTTSNGDDGSATSVIPKKFCMEKDEIWTNGCVDTIESVNYLIRLTLLALIMMNLILSIMAGIVVIFQQKPEYEAY